MIRVGRSVVWNKIYKKDWLFNTGVKFSVGMIHEDVEFFVKLVPFINQLFSSLRLRGYPLCNAWKLPAAF